jgi:hypothetical protein
MGGFVAYETHKVKIDRRGAGRFRHRSDDHHLRRGSGSFEFSHPFYLADLGIIAEKEPTPEPVIPKLFTKVLSKTALRVGFVFILSYTSRNVVIGIILVIVYMIIAGHIIWFIEREEDGRFHTSYLRGVATGVW